MASALTDSLVVTCEHGGNRVPARYRGLFRGLQGALQTHAGYDLGALAMARELSAAFKAPLVAATVTRLLVDLNRSIGHPRLHGEAIRALSREARERILADHYQPYRMETEARIRQAISRGRRVIHVSSHSFTPELRGKVRAADVGLLYDPARKGEARLCARWKIALSQAFPQLRVRRNYPYDGTDDGFMPYLRRRFRPTAYVGVEIEINQAIVIGAPRRWAALRTAIIASLRAALVDA
jgi:predicted N-formylglutamate amidohydrolase